MADYLYLAAFLFSGYQEYLGYPMYSFLYLSSIIIFYLIFLEIYGKKIIRYSKIRNDISIAFLSFKARYFKYLTPKNGKRIRQIMAAIFIIVIIAVLFGGNYYLKTTTQIVEEKTTRLIIDDMFINRDHLNISGDYYVEQNYSIKFGLIPWTKMRPNITLRDSSDNPTNANYNFDGGYLLINNSRWFNTTNVILYGRKKDNVPPFYTLKIKDLNETNQRWDITFYTNYTYDIDIHAVDIEKGNLRLINYTTDNLALDDVVNNPTDHYIVLKHVWFAKYWHPQYANHSITLFFEKNNTI